jgi:predicted small integral membrane protein
MKLNRIVAYLIGCVVIAFSFHIYLEYIHWLGFPDGFITELGDAQRRLAYIFIGISVMLGSCFIYLGAIGLRKAIGRRLWAAIILYIISIISVYLIDYYYRSHLTGGSGG